MSRLRERLPILLLFWGAFLLLHIACRSVNFQLKSPLCGITVLFSLIYIFTPAKLRSLFANGLLAVSTLYLTAAALDLLVRPWVIDRFYYRPEERFYTHWTRHDRIGRYAPLVDFKGTVYGDLAAMAQRPEWRDERQVRFQTDRFGFRNEDPRPTSPVSLFVLGDSAADGTGVTQPETVTSRLRALSSKPAYNLSIICIGPWGEYVNLISEWPRLPVGERPRIYWVLFTANDMEDPCWPASPEKIQWKTPWERVRTRVQNIRRHSAISYFLLGLDQSVQGAKRQVIVKDFFGKPLLFFDVYRDEARRTARDLTRHRYMPDVQKSIQAMGAWAREHKVEVVVVSLSSKEQVYEWVLKDQKPWPTPAAPTPFFLAIQDICQKAGLKAIDLNPCLVKESKRLYEKTGELLWWRDDTHPNGQGHAAVARFIMELERKRPKA